MSNIFLKGLQSAYKALETKNPNAIYFLTDSREIYVGDKLYAEPLRLYTGSLPLSAIALGALYINTETGLGSVHNGTAWNTVMKPVVGTIDATASDDTVPTTKGVKDYVDGRVEDILGGEDIVTGVSQALDGDNAPVPGTLTITSGDGSTANVVMTGLANNPTYDSTNLVLTIPVVGGSPLVVNLPQDNFIESGEYDTDTKNIVLTLKDGSEVTIPASALVDIYTSGSGVNDTVTVSVGSDNKISATVKVDTSGGVLGIAADGKLTVDLSDYATAESLDDLGERVTAVEENVTWGSF